jgi:cell division protein FtsI/penicillin-binding protein 2
MSPKSGEILAMASLPTADPDEPSAGALGLRRNRALTDPVEPGSAFKPVIIAGALEGGFVTRHEQIDCENGTWHIPGRTVTDTVPYGTMDLKGIMVRSSNIGMTKIAQRMGNKPLHDTMRRFGFGTKTGIELPGESAGRVYPLSKWSGLSLSSVCIGYEVFVTPLQLVNAFATLINDGVLLRPRIVKALLTPDGEMRASFDEPVPLQRAVSVDVARFVVHELLVAVVEDGSARIAQVGPYRVLGKTGTAKLPYRDRKGYEPGQYQSTFVGAAPAHDPLLVTLVMIRRPDASAGYYGSKVAAPAAGAILAESLAYLQVPPDEEFVVAEAQ